MASDVQRRIIGRKVYAKELHVTALTECAKQYGSWSKPKEVVGTVIERIGNKTRNNWLSTYVIDQLFLVFLPVNSITVPATPLTLTVTHIAVQILPAL